MAENDSASRSDGDPGAFLASMISATNLIIQKERDCVNLAFEKWKKFFVKLKKRLFENWRRENAQYYQPAESPETEAIA